VILVVIMPNLQNVYAVVVAETIGVGFQKAINITRTMTEELLQRAQTTGTKIEVKLPEPPRQHRDAKGRFIKVEKELGDNKIK